MKVLVTGGAGCIGLEVCRELMAQQHEVRLFDLRERIVRIKAAIPSGTRIFSGSILDRSSIREAVAGCDGIIHLAAFLGVERTERKRLRTLEVNIEGTKNMLEVAVANRVNRVVFASSSEVYGEPLKNPIDESAVPQGKTVYAVSKLAGEELCRAYSQAYPWLEHVILRYFNTYGKNQVAKFVIPRFVHHVLGNKPPVVYGGGQQIRSFCFATDTAYATVQATTTPAATGEVINVGNSKQPVSLLKLAEMVLALAGRSQLTTPEIIPDFEGADRTSHREIYERYCDTTKARKILAFEPKVTLEQGIRSLLDTGSILPDWQTPDNIASVDPHD